MIRQLVIQYEGECNLDKPDTVILHKAFLEAKGVVLRAMPPLSVAEMAYEMLKICLYYIDVITDASVKQGLSDSSKKYADLVKRIDGFKKFLYAEGLMDKMEATEKYDYNNLWKP